MASKKEKVTAGAIRKKTYKRTIKIPKGEPSIPRELIRETVKKAPPKRA